VIGDPAVGDRVDPVVELALGGAVEGGLHGTLDDLGHDFVHLVGRDLQRHPVLDQAQVAPHQKAYAGGHGVGLAGLPSLADVGEQLLVGEPTQLVLAALVEVLVAQRG
jgi:hypothetical protein